MFPKNENYNTTIAKAKKTEQQDKELGISPEFNFTTGQHIIVDGHTVDTTLEENVKQFIEVVLKTRKNEFEIYANTNFGISLYEYLSKKNIQRGFILSETKREIINNLLKNPAIKEVNKFDFKHIDTILYISFNVELTNKENFIYKGEVNVR